MSLGFLFYALMPMIFIFEVASAEVQQNKFISQADSLLTLRRIIILPVKDNVSDIYGRPATESLSTYFKEKRFLDVEVLEKNQFEVAEGLLDKADQLKLFLSSKNSQALVEAQIWKGPQGLQLRQNLYFSDGLPLLRSDMQGLDIFSLEDVQAKLIEQLEGLLDQLPFRGEILSRRGNEVTVSLGKAEGIETGSTLNVIQIIKLQRHPKTKVLVDSQKVLLGQVRIGKVEEHLSFGQVVQEIESQAVGVSAKIQNPLPAQYPLKDDGSLATAQDNLDKRVDSKVAFGEKPKTWLPKETPQYGRFELQLGFIQYNQNLGFVNQGSKTASQSLGSTIALGGEAWINDLWFVDFGIKQSAFSVNNTLDNSSPSRLNMSVGKYYLAGGYNFLLENDFWGPKLQLTLGLSQFNALADSSNPLFLGKMNYGGIYTGLKGQMQVLDERPLYLGFKLKYFWTNSVGESQSSGSASGVKSTEFGFFGSYKYNDRFNFTGELSFDYYTSSFSGGGDRSSAPVTDISHKVTNILAGLEIYF